MCVDRTMYTILKVSYSITGSILRSSSVIQSTCIDMGFLHISTYFYIFLHISTYFYSGFLWTSGIRISGPSEEPIPRNPVLSVQSHAQRVAPEAAPTGRLHQVSEPEPNPPRCQCLRCQGCQANIWEDLTWLDSSRFWFIYVHLTSSNSQTYWPRSTLTTSGALDT